MQSSFFSEHTHITLSTHENDYFDVQYFLVFY